MATPHRPHWQWLPTPRSGRRGSLRFGIWAICLLLLWAAAPVWGHEAGSADEAEEPEPPGSFAGADRAEAGQGTGA